VILAMRERQLRDEVGGGEEGCFGDALFAAAD
jgi:hypothetical protein